MADGRQAPAPPETGSYERIEEDVSGEVLEFFTSTAVDGPLRFTGGTTRRFCGSCCVCQGRGSTGGSS